MSTIIVMPQLGESVAEGVIGKWLKNEGDAIERDEPIVEVITDKVNAEIPSPVAGILHRITQPEGATVAVGQEIAVITDDHGSGDPIPDAGAERATASASNGQRTSGGAAVAVAPVNATAFSTAATGGIGGARGERVRSSPLVRRLAEQQGIDLAQVSGTGIGGRVSKQDIIAFVQRKETPASAPHLQSAAVETIEWTPPSPPRATMPPPAGAARSGGANRELGPNEQLVPISPLRRMIADRMIQSVSVIPHATTMADVDMTPVVRYREARKDEFRTRENAPLSYVAFVIKATVEALKEFPLVNAEWAGDGIVLKNDININVAVDAPEGLTTPVIHHADERSLAGLSKSIFDLATRARNKRLKIDDMQGGTFTVNNTGAIGSVSGVSIINYPQGGILAAAAIVKRPVVIEQAGEDLIAVRSIMNLSFTFDHRLLDGGYAAGFVAAVKRKLESWPQDYPLY